MPAVATAYSATVTLVQNPLAELATATLTVLTPKASIAPHADLSAAVGTSQTPAPKVAPSAGSIAITGTAQTATKRIAPSPSAGSATATAHNATGLSNDSQADAETIEVFAEAYDATATSSGVAPEAGLAAATGDAFSADFPTASMRLENQSMIEIQPGIWWANGEAGVEVGGSPLPIIMSNWELVPSEVSPTAGHAFAESLAREANYPGSEAFALESTGGLVELGDGIYYDGATGLVGISPDGEPILIYEGW